MAKSWIFVSKHKNLQIWLKPPRESFDSQGKLRVEDPGVLVEFRGGYYETDNKEVAEMLVQHPLYKLAFDLYRGDSVFPEDLKRVSLQTLNDLDIRSKIKPVLSEETIKRELGIAKRTYTCPDCGEVFPSGFHLARHKKEVHSTASGG